MPIDFLTFTPYDINYEKLMIGFEKDFSCHSHLGSIRISLLFPFPPEPLIMKNYREITLTSGKLNLKVQIMIY